MNLAKLEDEFYRLERAFGEEPGASSIPLQIAGARVEIRCSHRPLLEALRRPFQHLQTRSAGPPDLVIEVLAGPPLEHLPSVYFTRSPEGDFALQILPRSRSLWRRAPAKIVAEFHLPLDRLSLYELGRPFHAMLSLWLNDRDTPLIHAGLLEKGGRGMLVGGDSGAGKTTLCLAGLETGWGWLGDDLVAVDARFVGHSLYATTFLSPERRQRQAFLGPDSLQPRHPEEEKCLTYLTPRFLSQLRASVPIAALALPAPSRQGPEIETLRPMQALRGLAPSSILVGGLSGGQAALDRLSDLVARVPSVRVAWGCSTDRLHRWIEST